MSSLEEMKSRGFISPKYTSVPLKNFNYRTISEVEAMTDEEKSSFDGAVVCNNVEWIATFDGITQEKAIYVLSGDASGEHFGKWTAPERTFISQVPTNTGLTLKKKIKLPKFIRRKNSMAMTFDEQALNDALNGANLGGDMNPDRLKEFDIKPDENAKEDKYGAIKRELGTVELDHNIVNFNRKHGRLLGFITNRDRCIKLTTRKEKIVENNVFVLTQDCPAEQRSAYEADKSKKPADKYIQKEVNAKLVESKPGAICNVIYTIPEGGDQSLSLIVSGNAVLDATKTAKIVKIVPTELAFDAISVAFGGTIMESEEVLGAKADTILAVSVIGKGKVDPATGQPTNVTKCSFKLAKGSKRSSVITENNYIPKTVYNTVPLMSLSPEMSKVLNASVKAVIKDDKYAALSPASKKLITLDQATGEMTCQYFAPGVATVDVTVARFDDPKQPLSAINYPIRREVVSKNDPSKKSWKYETFNLDDEAKGPFSKPEFQDFLKKANVTKEMIKQAVNTKSGNGGKQRPNVLSTEQYIAAKYKDTSGVFTFKDNTASLSEIDALLLRQTTMIGA